jgi:hypothetical protein
MMTDDQLKCPELREWARAAHEKTYALTWYGHPRPAWTTEQFNSHWNMMLTIAGHHPSREKFVRDLVAPALALRDSQSQVAA